MTTTSESNFKIPSLIAVGALASLSSYYLWTTFQKKKEFLHSVAIVGTTTIACLAAREILFFPDTDKKDCIEHCKSEWDKKKQSTSRFFNQITTKKQPTK